MTVVKKVSQLLEPKIKLEDAEYMIFFYQSAQFINNLAPKLINLPKYHILYPSNKKIEKSSLEKKTGAARR